MASRILNYVIAAVWLINGLFCKLLDLVPRHRIIISQILGQEYELLFTRLIGIGETLMAVWIISRLYSRVNVCLQILLIMVMNLIEFFSVPDLLLFGRLNLVLAILFSLLIYANEFILKPRQL